MLFHRHPSALLSFIFAFLACQFSIAQTKPASENSSKSKKILIVYLTRTGNTEAVAEMIREATGGKLVELELVHPYPKDYKEHVAQVVRENETGFLPPIKTKIDSLESFDIVFIGFPTWDMQIPPPISSFLLSNDFQGKTVVPFNTNAGYGVGNGFEKVKSLCMKSKVLTGFIVTGGKERDGILLAIKGDRRAEVKKEIQDWLRSIGVLN